MGLRSVCLVVISLLTEVPESLEYYWKSVDSFWQVLDTLNLVLVLGCERGSTLRSCSSLSR